MIRALVIGKVKAAGRSGLGLGAALVLGACVSQSIPVAPKKPLATTPNVSVAGVSQGKMIGAGGARPTLGQAITVRGLTNAQGNEAKKSAAAECKAVGGSFNELALASYDQINQAWVFIGACA